MVEQISYWVSEMSDGTREYSVEGCMFVKTPERLGRYLSSQHGEGIQLVDPEDVGNRIYIDADFSHRRDRMTDEEKARFQWGHENPEQVPYLQFPRISRSGLNPAYLSLEEYLEER